MTGKSISFGEALAMGLAQGTNNYIGLSNQLGQQRQQQENVLADQQFRQQQADQQAQQFAAQQKQARDSQAFQWLQGEQQKLLEVLSKGGFAKDSAKYQAAETALRETNRLMRSTIRGVELTSDEQSGYDTLLGNVATVLGQGAAELGGHVAAVNDLDLRGKQVDVGVAEGTAPFRVKAAEYQTGLLGSQLRVAEGTEGDMINRPGLENTGLALQNDGRGLANEGQGLQNDEFRVTSPYRQTLAKNDAAYSDLTLDDRVGLVDSQARQGAAAAGLSEKELEKVTQTFDSTVEIINSTNDLGTSKNVVLKGLLQLEGATARADYLGRIAGQGEIGTGIIQGLLDDGLIDQPTADGALSKAARVSTAETTQLDILTDQAAITGNDRTLSDQTLAGRVELFNSDKDLRVKTNAAELDLLELKTPAQRAAYLQGIAKTGSGGAAILDSLAKAGLITTAQADGFKKTAGNAQTVDDAAAAGATLANDAAEFNLKSAKDLFPIQLKSAQTALDSANEQLAAFKEQRPVNLDILRGNLKTLNQALEQDAQLFGPRLAQARAAVRQLESQVRVMEQTEGAQVVTADAQATGAVNAATISGAQATVAVQLIPSQIQAGKIGVQQAQASLDATLAENKFADATFGNRVRGVEVNTLAGVRQLMALRQGYSQNAAKFPKELEYLNAQIATMDAQAKKAVADSVGVDGGVTDKKTVLTSLDAMRKINADERRIAANNLRNVTQRLMPNAKFSIDKYDPKSFTTLVANASNLAPEQRQELEQAQLAYDTAAGKSSDLSTAFAQVSGKGRMDPKLAEQLGFFAPGEGEDANQFISGPSAPPAKAPKARNVPAGIVSGEGGVVFSGGGARAVQSLLPQTEITKQIAMTVDHYVGKIKQQGGYSNPWDNTAGPVRAYNGMGPSLDVQKRYVNDIRATSTAQPWVQAISDATGARKTELQFINAEATRIAKAKGVDPNVIKAIMWNESMGWQPGIPSSDGKGGGLGQVTGYFPPKGSTYSSNTRGGAGPTSGTARGPATKPPTGTMGSDGKPLPPGWSPAELAAAARASVPNAATPDGVAAKWQAEKPKLTGFFTQIQKAPSTAVATKLLHDQAIRLAGGPNAPQALKSQYFDLLLAAAKGTP